MIWKKAQSIFIEIFRIERNVTRQMSWISLLKFRIAVAEMTTYEYLFDSAPCIDLTFYSRVYSRVFYNIACVRACATTVKKYDLSASAALHVLFPRIIIRCLYVRTFDISVILYSRYICVCACLHLYTWMYAYICFCTYLHTEMFALLLLLTYYTCRRNVRNWLPWSDSFNNRIIVSDNVRSYFNTVFIIIIDTSGQLSVIGFSELEKTWEIIF